MPCFGEFVPHAAATDFPSSVPRFKLQVTESKFNKAGRLAILLVISWCVMTMSHELGHIVAGRLGGGRLVQFDIAPWRLPYSFFDPDPRPLVTLWSGPILGSIGPLLLAVLVRRSSAWFVACFCMLANGLYLAVAPLTSDSYLDTTKLLEHGASPIAIAAFCVATIVPGYLGIRRCLIEFWRNEGRTPVASETEQSELRQ